MKFIQPCLLAGCQAQPVISEQLASFTWEDVTLKCVKFLKMLRKFMAEWRREMQVSAKVQVKLRHQLQWNLSAVVGDSEVGGWAGRGTQTTKWWSGRREGRPGERSWGQGLQKGLQGEQSVVPRSSTQRPGPGQKGGRRDAEKILQSRQVSQGPKRRSCVSKAERNYWSKSWYVPPICPVAGVLLTKRFFSCRNLFCCILRSKIMPWILQGK